jgi:hypothetical protein
MTLLADACPIIASYGARDRSLAKAPAQLEQVLTANQVTHDIRVYPGAGHGFLNDHAPGETAGRAGGTGFFDEKLTPSLVEGDRRCFSALGLLHGRDHMRLAECRRSQGRVEHHGVERIDKFVTEGLDRGGHHAGGARAITGLERGEQSVVLGVRSQAALRSTSAQGDQARALAVVEQSRHDLGGATVAGASRHVDMDRTVGLHEALCRRGVIEVGRRIEKCPQAGELPALEVPGRGRGCGWFKYQAQIVDLAHVAQRQRGDHMSAAWLCEHEPLHPQAGQCSPDGGLGEAEALDELRFGDRRTRHEFDADDGAAKALVGGRT